MKVLIIYNLVPEKLYQAIVDMTEEEFEFFSKAHNKYGEQPDLDDAASEAINVIGNAFSTYEGGELYCETDKELDYYGKWVENEVGASDGEPVDLKDVDKMIMCGFYL